jgi:hypothetical protein
MSEQNERCYEALSEILLDEYGGGDRVLEGLEWHPAVRLLAAPRERRAEQ